MQATAPVTAIVTAHIRVKQALHTLQVLHECSPRPAEIIVHVDGEQHETKDAIREAFPHVPILLNPQQVGPGGARNLLIATARHEYVAAFDDDSYPIDKDYFSGVVRLFDAHPDASILYASLYHRGDEIKPASETVRAVSSFVGCACVYRRSAFLKTKGYVPLPLAYGMEEVDLSLQIKSCGQTILQVGQLRVFHDTDLSHHANPAITSACIANLALLAFLRYPVILWPYGLGQVANRVRWCLRAGRQAGVVQGLLTIPAHLWRHRRHRNPLRCKSVVEYLRSRT